MHRPSARLGIDAAEWFLDPVWRQHVTPRHWRRLPARAALAVRAVAARLQREGRTATWFVPAEMATAAPELLRALVAAGHELALAGVATMPLDDVPADERAALAQRWRAQRDALAAAGGVAVRGFRAVWPVAATAAAGGWWQEALAAQGFAYDATSSDGGAASAHALAVRVPSASSRESSSPPPPSSLSAPPPSTFPPSSAAAAASVPLQLFAAWRLDSEQPQLHGLPRDRFAAHAAQLDHADAALAALLANTADGPVATALALPPAVAAAVAVLSAPPTPSVPTPHEPRAGVPRLCVVVPLKDEEAGLDALFVELDAVRARLHDVAACEFVCVDDGSGDRTFALLQQHAAARPFVRVVQHAHNRGVAAAIQTGLGASDAEFAASIDGDLSYDPMELRAMLALLHERAATVVTASPYHPRGGVRNVPGWRLALSRTLSFAYRLLLWSPLHTWTACFRVYRRAAVAELPLVHPGFLGTAELLVRVLRRGGVVVEHPCVLEARLFGFSKMKVLRTIRQHLGLLWQVTWRRIR